MRSTPASPQPAVLLVLSFDTMQRCSTFQHNLFSCAWRAHLFLVPQNDKKIYIWHIWYIWVYLESCAVFTSMYCLFNKHTFIIPPNISNQLFKFGIPKIGPRGLRTFGGCLHLEFADFHHFMSLLPIGNSGPTHLHAHSTRALQPAPQARSQTCTRRRTWRA